MNPKSNAPLHPDGAAPVRPVPASQANAARLALEQALSFHLRGERASALKSIRKALGLDPGLANDRLAGNLAHELTGLPVGEALRSLLGEQSGRDLVQAARREQKKVAPPSFRQFFMAVSLAIALMVLAGMYYWADRTGVIGSYVTSLQMARWETQKQRLSGYDYYALVPAGSPPNDGWPVVVAFHGMGGEGGHMLPFAQAFLEKGILFVAPTFGDYEPWPKGPIEVMSSILDEVGKNHPLQSRGAVLLGHSQGGTFAYRFSVYHPEQVAGVVTAGAPEFDSVYPARRTMPYVFTWGEGDWLQEYVLPTAFGLRNSGFNVSIYIVPKAEHEMTRFAVEKALNLLVER